MKTCIDLFAWAVGIRLAIKNLNITARDKFLLGVSARSERAYGHVLQRGPPVGSLVDPTANTLRLPV